MGLKARYTKADVRKEFQRQLSRVHLAILSNLAYLGELCVNQARSINTYRDQTGNLRNSIGYVIVHNGQIIRSDFGKSARVSGTGSTGGSQSGVIVGRQLANELATQYTTGYALIVVAGMNYAATVESRGLDVLTSAEQLAQTELPRMLRELKADIGTLR